MLTQRVNWLIIFVIALLIVLFSAPWTIRPLIESWTEPTSVPAAEEWPTAPATFAAVQPTAQVVQRSMPTATLLPSPQWQELSYLTSIEFTTSSVVETQRKTDVPLVGEMVTDRLLLKVVGKVQVGIDLSQVQNVRIEGKTIRFDAPKPIVTSVELLPNESQIFDHQQVLFMSQYAGMEKEAMETARQQLRQEVSQNASMMELAEEFARLHLTEFLRQAGFDTVTITFKDSRFDD
jgi:hypothetical protein